MQFDLLALCVCVRVRARVLWNAHMLDKLCIAEPWVQDM